MAFRSARRYGAAMNRVGVSIAVTLALTSPLLLAAATGAAAAPKAAPAASADAGIPAAETLGSAGGWSAYASRDQTGRVCYLAGHPQKSEAAGIAGRGQPMAMVTHRPAENIANVVSFVEGYTLKDGSTATLDIGGKKFDLFTHGDSAWAATSDLDHTIVMTLAKSGSAVIKGESDKGRTTTDVYTLAGFAKALALIDKACGVTRAGVAAAAAAPAETVRPHPHPHRPTHKIAHKKRAKNG